MLRISFVAELTFSHFAMHYEVYLRSFIKSLSQLISFTCAQNLPAIVRQLVSSTS